MAFSLTRSLAALALLSSQVLAGDDKWLSPVYNYFYQFPLPLPEVKQKTATYTNPLNGVPIDFYQIEIKSFEAQVYPNLGKARLVGYDGTSPGPTFMMEKGREAVVRFVNTGGDRASSIHLHGSYSMAPFDGWAEDTTDVNQYKDYYYPNAQSARTLWYHDHAIHHTAENAYYGQAGFYILHDPADDALELPSGKYDVPLSLSSKQYNADGSLFDPVDETVSLYGDVIHVNGQPWPYFNVEPRRYRFRFLDTSISRSFKLYFEADGALGKQIPFKVIGSDAGLLTGPVSTDLLQISMAERWEVIFDFTSYAGKNVTLRNQRKVEADEDYNSTDKVMKFVVGTAVTSSAGDKEPPSTLRTVPFPPNKNGVDRTFKFERTNGMWKVNGVTFADINNRILAKPQRGDVEVWELQNGGGGWSHPIHIHLIDFQVISRKGTRDVLPYEAAALKDVVWLGGSETVRVIARFAPWAGVYMFHCHNLIHEDHDMMAAFNVSKLENYGYNDTTYFIDPMEERWRSKDIKAEDFTPDAIQNKLSLFGSLNAYANVNKVEDALIDYYKTFSSGATSATTTRSSSTASTFSTVTKTTSSASVTASPSTTKTSSTKTSSSSSSKSSTSTKK